jgi:hypothetical protein
MLSASHDGNLKSQMRSPHAIILFVREKGLLERPKTDGAHDYSFFSLKRIFSASTSKDTFQRHFRRHHKIHKT